MKTACLFLAATAALLLAPGCGTADRPATWEYISPVIIQPNCATASCHSPGVAAAGLDFSDPDVGYSSLTRLWVWIVDPTKEGQPGCGKRDGTIVCEELFRPLVTPYDPAQSRLVNMLHGRTAPLMPPDRPIDGADIQLIENWILNGAKRHADDVGAPQDAGVDDAGDAAASLDDAATDQSTDQSPASTANTDAGGN